MARTLADLEGSDAIRLEHAAEAVQYRSLDREEAVARAYQKSGSSLSRPGAS